MTTPFEISDRYTEAWATLHPISATAYGIAGHDDECGDWSPESHARSADLSRSVRAELTPHLGDADPTQAFAAKVLCRELDTFVEQYEANEWRRDLNHVASPFQNIRDVFDVMPKVSPEDWESIRARLAGFAGMLDGYRRSLAEGVAAGDTVASRQAESVAEQAAFAASESSTFLTFPGLAADAGYDSESIESAVSDARRGCAEFADWLRSEYLPAADPSDAVGEERYLRQADHFLGMALDPHETYDWGWSEVRRLRAEMASTAAEIDSDMSVSEVVHMLDTDPTRAASTREEFVEFVSAIQQKAIAQLDGEHFDVPDELKAVTVSIAPAGVPLGAWYVGPSEDFRRPGSIWYAPGERKSLPYWQEVSTAYHEGFPGHHLQVGATIFQREKLSRFHRAVIWYPGSGEGWALYAERLMDELGFFEKPEYRLGWLSSQLFRSIRVVLDIGCQLEKRIPDDAPLYDGEVWDFERGVDYMNLVGGQARDVSESEVKRYLGWWGQAISYKVGEREILSIRDDAMVRDGAAFDRKEFHQRMLDAGAVRLDHLREALI
jgi:uncharacterized protein (DUF885 family)